MFYYYTFFYPYLNNFRGNHSASDQSIFSASSQAAPGSQRTTDTLILLISPMTALLVCQLPPENPYLTLPQGFLVCPVTKIHYYFLPKVLLLCVLFLSELYKHLSNDSNQKPFCYPRILSHLAPSVPMTYCFQLLKSCYTFSLILQTFWQHWLLVVVT